MPLRSTEEVPLIVAPARAFGGDFDRCWLLAVQLYGVRSRAQLGDGRFHRSRRPDRTGRITSAPTASASIRCMRCSTTVRAIAARIRRTAGCFSTRSISTSKSCPEFQLDAETKAALARLRALDVVDYVAVAGLKWRALRAAFAAFKADATPAPAAGFRQFRAERGTLLSRFACFEVLRHEFGKPWWEWPEEWRQPDDAACAALRSGADAAEIEFVEFVQWTADRQLGARQRSGKEARHEGRALSRRRRRRAGRRLRCLERAGRDLPPSRRRRAAGSAQHRRPELGPRRLQCRRARAAVLRAVSPRCCAPRCATPARSGSTTCWA